MGTFRFNHRIVDIARMFPEFALGDSDVMGRFERLIELLERRDLELERYLSHIGHYPLIFFHDGELNVSDSGIYISQAAWEVQALTAALVVAGDTDTEVQLLIDGIVRVELTIPAFETEAHTNPTNIRLPAGSRMVARIITPGDDAFDLTLIAELRQL